MMKPTKGKRYSFGNYIGITYLGLAYTLEADKIFVFSTEGEDTWFSLTKDQWYSQDIQQQLKMLCDVPPEGWYCTRDKGHEGPCAALPKEKSNE